MSIAYQHEFQPCSPLGHQTGFWKLSAGRALTLQPREWGELRIVQGRVWITFDGAWRERADLWGDHVVSAGQSIALPPGARVVMETWDPKGCGPVFFNWTPRPSPALTRWQREVRRPLSDLSRSVGAASLALVRLLGGLAAYGEFLVAGRGRVLTRFESNPP